ncbi:MAG: hypothetical protein H0Z35_08825 [Thermoanaerobacteraceae bacterium]|nr:hypothetical protein [Thermoanaerobacteraceae bacterium]
MTGIANLKAVFFVILLLPVISLILPDGKEFCLYWALACWTFFAYKSIILDDAGWSQLVIYLAGALVITLSTFFLWMKKRFT